jgi:hypothetical protein
MVVKRIGPMSMAKMQGAMGVLIGLLLGICFAAFASLGSAIASSASEGNSLGMFSAIFGVGAIIILPIMYGIFGFIGGLIGAVLYNWVAGMVGGIEIETS